MLPWRSQTTGKNKVEIEGGGGDKQTCGQINRQGLINRQINRQGLINRQVDKQTDERRLDLGHIFHLLFPSAAHRCFRLDSERVTIIIGPQITSVEIAFLMRESDVRSKVVRWKYQVW